jgi:hypothetical protein
MLTQLVGTLMNMAGVLYFLLLSQRPTFYDPRQRMLGAGLVLGGLILWALGRIECAVLSPEEREPNWQKRSLGMLIVMLVWGLIAVAIWKLV